jgi:hypothetical protein
VSEACPSAITHSMRTPLLVCPLDLVKTEILTLSVIFVDWSFWAGS